MHRHAGSYGMLKGALLSTVVAVLAVFAQAPAGAADAKTLGQKELKNLIANAKTKADHERIAQHFDAEATKYDADAKDHMERAKIYQSSQAIYQNAQMFNHCDSLGTLLSKAAQDARALASEHREMAAHPAK